MKKLLKITKIATLQKITQFSNYQRYWFQILIAQIEDLIEDEDFVKISHPYLLLFPINQPSQTVTIRPGRVGYEPTRLNKLFSDFFSRIF